MAKILLIGGIGAGKTTLKQTLMNEDINYRKTQMLKYSEFFVDCPGEYLQVPIYYQLLIDTSHKVSEIWALQDATKQQSFYPPKFAKVFKKPVIGIITKLDLPNANLERATKYLLSAGLTEPFIQTSITDEKSFDPLRRRIEALR